MSALVQHHLEEDAVSQRAGRMQSSALNRENNSFAYCLEMMLLGFFFLRLMISQPQNAPSTFSPSGARNDLYTDYFKGIASQ